MAGARSDNLKSWALPKGQSSGHCQRLIDTRIEELNITRVKPLTLCVPGQSRVRRRRTDLRVQ
eukprot:2734884-Pyramimonas_sp.AAC.1